MYALPSAFRDTAETDAERAVMCVMEMCGALERWNNERVQKETLPFKWESELMVARQYW